MNEGGEGYQALNDSLKLLDQERKFLYERIRKETGYKVAGTTILGDNCKLISQYLGLLIQEKKLGNTSILRTSNPVCLNEADHVVLVVEDPITHSVVAFDSSPQQTKSFKSLGMQESQAFGPLPSLEHLQEELGKRYRFDGKNSEWNERQQLPEISSVQAFETLLNNITSGL